MTRLLSVDLSETVPQPIAHPDLEDLHGWYDAKERGDGLNMGTHCRSPWRRMRIEISDDHESLPGLTDWMKTVPFTIVSRRFVSVLREFDCNSELLPLEASYRGKSYTDEFFALNALRVVKKAVDLSQSKIGFYDDDFGMAEDVERLVLLPDSIGDAPLAFLWEIGVFAVSDQMASGIRAAGVVGCKMLPPEEFRS